MKFFWYFFCVLCESFAFSASGSLVFRSPQ